MSKLNKWKPTIYNVVKLIAGFVLIPIVYYLLGLEGEGPINPDNGPFDGMDFGLPLLLLCFYLYWLYCTFRLMIKSHSKAVIVVNFSIVLFPYLLLGIRTMKANRGYLDEKNRAIEYKKKVVGQIKKADIAVFPVVLGRESRIIHYYQKEDTLFYAVKEYDFDSESKIVYTDNGTVYNLGKGTVSLFAFADGKSVRLPTSNSYGKVNFSSDSAVANIDLKYNKGFSDSVFIKHLEQSGIVGCKMRFDNFEYNIAEGERKNLPIAPPKVQKDHKGILYAPVLLVEHYWSGVSTRCHHEAEFPAGLIRENYFVASIGKEKSNLYKIPADNRFGEYLLGISAGKNLYAITDKSIIKLLNIN